MSAKTLSPESHHIGGLSGIVEYDQPKQASYRKQVLDFRIQRMTMRPNIASGADGIE